MDTGIIVAIVMFAVFGGSALWGIVDTILSHRKQMAELKFREAGKREVLTSENAELKETVAMMQDRIAVLERIATDPSRRTAEAIEALRRAD